MNFQSRQNTQISKDQAMRIARIIPVVLVACLLFGGASNSLAGHPQTVNTCADRIQERITGGTCASDTTSSQYCTDRYVYFAHNVCRVVPGSPSCQPWVCEARRHSGCGYVEVTNINWSQVALLQCAATAIDAGCTAFCCTSCVVSSGAAVPACLCCAAALLASSGELGHCWGCGLVASCDPDPTTRQFVAGNCLCFAGCPPPPNPKPTPTPIPAP